MNYLKVTGHDGLVRDTSSQAIINTNVSDYNNYIKQRNAAKARLSEQDRQAEELNNIKSELSDIKQMLVMLLKDR